MTVPATQNVVVIGAGYGGITATLRLARMFRRHPEYEIHLIDRNPFHTMKTQLHEAAVRRREVTIDIGRIIRRYNIRFHLGEARKLDVTKKVVVLDDATIPFDTVVLAVGSQSNFYSIPGLAEHAFTLQSLEDAERIHGHIRALCARAASEEDSQRRRALLRFVVGGGGLTGVEFAAELADHVAESMRHYRIPAEDAEIYLIEAMEEILPTLTAPQRRKTLNGLLEKGIRVRSRTRIVSCTPKSVNLSTNETLASGTIVWTGGIHTSRLIQESGMKTGAMGRLIVDEFLRSVDHPFVYAIGDNALAMNPQTGKHVPAAAQFALQQGRLVASNIYADSFGGRKRHYEPKVMGEVVSLGRHLAVGWVALPWQRKIGFFGFLASLLKAAIVEKHVILLRKESRNWTLYSG